MDFGEALKELKAGEKIRRKSWKGNDYYCLNSGNIAYYNDFNKGIFLQSNIKSFDILSDDWVVIIEPPKTGDIIKLNCGQKGIILKARLDGGHCVLMDDGTTHVYDGSMFDTTGENCKEILDDLLNVLA